MEQETMRRKGCEVIVTPIEELSCYQMADIQINTDESGLIEIRDSNNRTVVSLFVHQGSVHRVTAWSAAEKLRHVSWFVDGDDKVTKHRDNKGMSKGSAMYQLKRVSQ
tara:strand:- start:640 stop:963 length:324 start_codon:yes stop_codon:yes gene_type:complete